MISKAVTQMANMAIRRLNMTFHISATNGWQKNAPAVSTEETIATRIVTLILLDQKDRKLLKYTAHPRQRPTEFKNQETGLIL
jgi:hypothetical protein